MKDNACRYERRFRSRRAIDTRKFLTCRASFKKSDMPLRYHFSSIILRDVLLPISRNVFDIGWKAEIVGNVGSTGDY